MGERREREGTGETHRSGMLVISSVLLNRLDTDQQCRRESKREERGRATVNQQPHTLLPLDTRWSRFDSTQYLPDVFPTHTGSSAVSRGPDVEFPRRFSSSAESAWDVRDGVASEVSSFNTLLNPLVSSSTDPRLRRAELATFSPPPHQCRRPLLLQALLFNRASTTVARTS